MKSILRIVRNVARHWVGDGFPVRTYFSYAHDAADVTPFLLLDYAGPHHFEPSTKQLGVGEHPHRGFETVTLVYKGGLEHCDSTGSLGTIGPGDVQWMTAASGVVHAEFHSREFARDGGLFEVVQLWVNLPAKEKMSTPRYQEILHTRIPHCMLEANAGEVRVIAGDWKGVPGSARTVTRLCVYDLRLKARGEVVVPAAEGHTAILLVLHGSITLQDQPLFEGEMALLERTGQDMAIACQEDATLLVLTGEPIHEPVVGQGPFVMNTMDEIRQALRDYQSGKMGRLSD